jgi:hypothetical protein
MTHVDHDMPSDCYNTQHCTSNTGYDLLQLPCDALNASRAPPQTSLSLLPLLQLAAKQYLFFINPPAEHILPKVHHLQSPASVANVVEAVAKGTGVVHCTIAASLYHC